SFSSLEIAIQIESKLPAECFHVVVISACEIHDCIDKSLAGRKEFVNSFAQAQSFCCLHIIGIMPYLSGNQAIIGPGTVKSEIQQSCNHLRVFIGRDDILMVAIVVTKPRLPLVYVKPKWQDPGQNAGALRSKNQWLQMRKKFNSC